MRLIHGGLIFLFLFVLAGVFVSPACGQITGRVEVIGFDGKYRPGCWTPMLVRLKSAGSPTDLYELRVWQYDLDGDRPYFSRRVNISADKGELSFWTYFIPEPIHEGLTTDSSTQQDLMQRLRITVHDKNGKELSQIPLASATASAIDRGIAGFDKNRAQRFVVFVGTAAAPPLQQYDPSNIVGIQEDLEFSRISPDRLPENSIGYEAVDAVVWLDGSPGELTAGSSTRMEALRTYVRMGGKLIISTQSQWQQLATFDDLMPVTISGMEPNDLHSPLKEMAGNMPFPRNVPGAPRSNPWQSYKKPFSIAVAEPKPGAVVDRYADRVANPTGNQDQIPWLVRMPYGFGSVVWVGQDLGSRELSLSVNWGWPAIWEEIFGSPSAPSVFPSQSAKMTYKSSGNVDFGFSVIDAMNLSGRGATLVGVTIAFFILYWLIAGPGSYFFLKYKQKATLSWFVFGAIALAATGVTMGVVRLMLRGAPEMKHVSLVRVHGDRSMPSMVVSRMGIYIPQDGNRLIELGTGDARYPSTLIPFPIHPLIHRRRGGDDYLFPAPRDYRVSVPVGEESPTASVSIPFRTTMKRLRGTWIGHIEPRIEGDPRLVPSARGEGYIAGTLRNLTGADLRDVYIAFRHQPEGVEPSYWMMHFPDWKADAAMDLATNFNPPPTKRVADISISTPEVRQGDFPVRGMIKDWIDRYKGTITVGGSFDNLKPIERLVGFQPDCIPILSFFNAFPVLRNGTDAARGDIHRSGVRDWDVSGALQAGELVIIARQEDSTLPMTMKIEGDRVEGNGIRIYQFILPLTPMPAAPRKTAATQLTTRATNHPTTRPK